MNWEKIMPALTKLAERQGLALPAAMHVTAVVVSVLSLGGATYADMAVIREHLPELAKRMHDLGYMVPDTMPEDLFFALASFLGCNSQG